MSDLKRDLRRYIDGLEEPVSVQETINRRRQRRGFQVPAAVLAGAAVVLVPAVVLIGLRLLPTDDGDVARTTVPPTTATATTLDETTTTTTEGTTIPPPALLEVPDLIGLDLEEATRVAEQAGFELEVTEMYPSRSDFGLVAAQDPLAGDSVDEEGSRVVVGVRVEAPCLSYSAAPFDVTPGNTAATVLFGCAQEAPFPDVSFPLVREVPEAPTQVEATLRALLAGLSEEQRLMGFSSFFSAETANALNSVVVSGGRLTVDFNDTVLVGNASTATGSLFFMAELQANLFQFDDIESIEFRLDGSCDAFYGWLQGECELRTRNAWEALVAEWNQQADVQPDLGPDLGPDEIVGKVFQGTPVEGSTAIVQVIGEDLSTTGYSEVGGWLLDSALDGEMVNWALHVTGRDGEMVWLVRTVGHDEGGRMIYTVRAVLEIPWDEVLPTLQSDPFLLGAANACTVGGAYDPSLVVMAGLNMEGEELTGDMNEVRAWTIDVDRASFKEIPADGVECYMEVAG